MTSEGYFQSGISSSKILLKETPKVFVFCPYLKAGITRRVDTTGARQAINGISLLPTVAHPLLTFLNVVNVLFGLGLCWLFAIER